MHSRGDGKEPGKKAVETGGQIRPTGRLTAHKIPRKKNECLEINVHEGIHVNDSSVAHIRGDSSEDTNEAVRVADSETRSSKADYEDGKVVSGVQGESPKGEEGAIEVCAELIRRLNVDGTNWGPPHRPAGNEGGVDCESRDGNAILRIQVTRVVAADVWRQLDQDKSVEWVYDGPNEAADEIRATIESKLDKYGGAQQDTLLALDARDTPAFAFRTVVSSFRKRHGRWALDQFQFQEVWIVGPLGELVHRLDVSE